MLNKKQQAYIDLLFSTSEAGLFPATKNGNCVYRTEDGRGCAVGIAIPKYKYRKYLEGRSLNFIPEELAEYLEKKTGFPFTFLEDAQVSHDIMADSEEWNHGDFVREINLRLEGYFKGLYS